MSQVSQADRTALMQAGCPDQATADDILANLPPGTTVQDVTRLLTHVQAVLVALAGAEHYTSASINWNLLPQLIAALASGNIATIITAIVAFFGPPAMKRFDFREGWGVFAASITPNNVGGLLTALEKVTGTPPPMLP